MKKAMLFLFALVVAMGTNVQAQSLKKLDGIIFDWADLGSTLSVDSDREGLIYNINGNIIVGKTIADFPAGFVVEKYRSLTGAVLVPWE